jgi:hypothetical protein
MTDEKWEETVGMIGEKFELLNRFSEELEEGGEREVVEFKGPLGLMRLERTKKPKVLDVKTTYSKRAGTSATQEKQITSDTEMVKYVKAYVEKNDDWIEMEMPV